MTRKAGKLLPPSTKLFMRFLREKGRPEISFFDEKTSEFDFLCKSPDARMKELTSNGVGVETLSAQPLLKEMEEVCGKRLFSIWKLLVGYRILPSGITASVLAFEHAMNTETLWSVIMILGMMKWEHT